MTGPEVELTGGVANRGLVHRVSDTVRRPLRPHSAATHALLCHLEEVGFAGSPRFLGIDDRGREVLSYVAGDAAVSPHPTWALSDEALVSVAELLRRYHDAVSTFDARDYEWERPVPEAFRGDVVCHNDPNLDNVVFRDGRAVALIDFDLAAPGSRVWDVAAAARFWSPLRGAEDVGDLRRGRSLERLGTFLQAYGRELIDPDGLVLAVLQNHEWLYDVVREGAAGGNASFGEYWARGAAVRAERSREWCLHNAAAMRAAVA